MIRSMRTLFPFSGGADCRSERIEENFSTCVGCVICSSQLHHFSLHLVQFAEWMWTKVNVKDAFTPAETLEARRNLTRNTISRCRKLVLGYLNFSRCVENNKRGFFKSKHDYDTKPTAFNAW